MKKKIETPSMDKYNLSFKNIAAFTLAEILLSLTVIGIVAAIALPSLLGNANERAWETQKKALYTRFSQALPLLPSLNGYGKLEEIKNGDNTEILDTAAETFIRDGLSKVMKITNICDNDHLSDCGLPDKIISIKGTNTIELSNITTMSGFNPKMTSAADWQMPDRTYEMLDTKAAAFETVNGESILVYYNPNCRDDSIFQLYGTMGHEGTVSAHFVQPSMCANFVYDLNGKKGPNTVGKDIGVIVAMYPTNSSIIAPNPYANNISGGSVQNEAAAKCKALNENLKLPTADEVSAMFYNSKFFNMYDENEYWSSTTSGEYALLHRFASGYRFFYRKDWTNGVRCIKR